MVTVTCSNDECTLGNEDRNVLGAPEFVECGGCGSHLAPRDPREDPPLAHLTPE